MKKIILLTLSLVLSAPLFAAAFPLDLTCVAQDSSTKEFNFKIEAIDGSAPLSIGLTQNQSGDLIFSNDPQRVTKREITDQTILRSDSLCRNCRRRISVRINRLF